MWNKLLALFRFKKPLLSQEDVFALTMVQKKNLPVLYDMTDEIMTIKTIMIRMFSHVNSQLDRLDFHDPNYDKKLKILVSMAKVKKALEELEKNGG